MRSSNRRLDSNPGLARRLYFAWSLRLGGALALAWFLIRVLPKPSRAAYPCQRAAFPAAAGFILWAASALGGMTALQRSRRLFAESRVLLAGLCLLLAIGAGGAAFVNLSPEGAWAQMFAPAAPTFVPSEPLNAPMGTGFGIKPGRVAWAHDARATTWDGTTNAPGWWDDSNTHPEIVEAMLSETVRSAGDAATVKEAWGKLFADFNKRHGKEGAGYAKGEKIAIKLNLNQVRSHGDNANASYIAPQLVMALARQLVKEAGVDPADVTFYDAIRQVPSTIFDPATKVFPGIHFSDSTGTDGREKAVADLKDPIALSGGSTTLYLPTCVSEAKYLINVSGLKGHSLAGVTLTAKNHLGSLFMANGRAGANSMHPYLTVKSGRGGAGQPMGAYNDLVDLIGHKDLGGKTVLYIIDGLYATRHNEYRLDPSCKWRMAPFDGNWTASLFASQDPVAIDSVAVDFERCEPTQAQMVTGAVDNYLHEAAQAGAAPSKTAYDPEKDGKPLTASLGVHEHWNNPAEKKYGRNLGTGAGIELVAFEAAAPPKIIAASGR